MPIDVHNHVIPPAVVDLVGRDGRFGVTLADGRWTSKNIGTIPLDEAWYSPEGKLREMDGKGLDRAVLSVAPKPLYYYELDLEPQLLMASTANEGLAAFCAGHEDRLRWMAHVPLGFPQAAADELARAAALGAVGVELGTSAAGRRLDDAAFDALWEQAEAAGLPVFLHPAYEIGSSDYCIDVAQGLPFEVTEAIHRLIEGRVLDRHPRLSVVAALGGGFFPYTAPRLAHYATYQPVLRDAPRDPWAYVGQVKFDSHVHSAAVLRFLVAVAGAANVLVGTDASFQSQTPDPLAELREAVDDEDALRAISDGNAEALFWRLR